MRAGQGTQAMWWDMAPGVRGGFEHWRSHEHFPERLALPGFERASRWADAGSGVGAHLLQTAAPAVATTTGQASRAERQTVRRLSALPVHHPAGQGGGSKA